MNKHYAIENTTSVTVHRFDSAQERDEWAHEREDSTEREIVYRDHPLVRRQYDATRRGLPEDWAFINH